MESDIGIQILGLFSVINQSHKNDLNLLPLEDLPSCPKNTQLVYLIMKTIINWSLSKIDIFPFFFKNRLLKYRHRAIIHKHLRLYIMKGDQNKQIWGEGM